ncbi:hypothetical protein KHC28_01490 [Ancylobacter sonchi]|uniref:hypothetical protein n=1 Tax=Ancylobacter sonchi TaxID=1937790 RepID=UPI001BD5B717|nr:hypothetical protein [Ancylobacter sonchi]MBS7532326.1 hypothetical protein [Ancylobacter sonchi]
MRVRKLRSRAIVLLMSLATLATAPEAIAQTACQSLAAQEESAGIDSLSLLVGGVTATAISAACGYTASSQASSSQKAVFLTCAAGACAALSDGFFTCVKSSNDWYDNVVRHAELASRKRQLGCG